MTGLLAPPILEALWTAVACVDSDDTFVAVNESYAAMLGTPSDAVIGRRLTDFAAREANAAFFEGLDATRADGRQRRVRNHSLDFDRVYDNIFSRAGDYVVIEVADVTDEAREHDRRLQIQSARDVIWERVVEYSLIVDLVERQIFASPAVWQRWPIEQLEAAVHDGTIANALDNPHRWSDEWVDESSLFDGRVERRDRRGVHHGRGAAPPERHPDGRGSGPLLRHPARAVAGGGRDPRRRHHLPRPDEHPALPGPADHGREGHGPAPRATSRCRCGRSTTDAQHDPAAVRRSARRRSLPTWGQPTTLADYLETFDEDSRIRHARACSAELGPDQRASLRVSSADHERHSTISLTTSRRAPSTIDAESSPSSRTSPTRSARPRPRTVLTTPSHVMRFAQGVAHDFGNVAQVVGGYAGLALPKQGSTHRGAGIDPSGISGPSSGVGVAAHRHHRQGPAGDQWPPRHQRGWLATRSPACADSSASRSRSCWMPVPT